MIDLHPITRAPGAGSILRRSRSRTPRPRSRESSGALVHVLVGERLDLTELRRIRKVLSERAAPSAVELDFTSTRGADGDALLLLEADISRLDAAGTPVRLRRLSSRLHVQLYLHPILRFALDADELFTDPDLDWPGFRPSRH